MGALKDCIGREAVIRACPLYLAQPSRMSSAGDVSSACASSKSDTTVGLRRPRSRSEMYCCEKPERSAYCSWVKPATSLSLRTLRPTGLRMSMHKPLAVRVQSLYLL